MKHRNSSQSVLACSRRANFSIVLTGNRAQFKFADGLRAVAAIGVALFHTYTYTGLSEQNQQLPVFFKILNLGDFAVAVFIVLSGFVLMLPVARTARFTVRGGIGQFLTRRARRILPPYYAAIVAFLIAILIIPGLNEKTGTAWDSKVPVSIDGIISHALMLHNLSPTWVYQIDGPAWSVATEWQIYFAMPLLLLPVWRHFGGRVAVVLAILIGWAVHFLLPPSRRGALLVPRAVCAGHGGGFARVPRHGPGAWLIRRSGNARHALACCCSLWRHAPVRMAQ
ncbi:acyltransferase [Curtobacterium sp. MCJR17_043]|uniref:acyltransferase family protein n=1 Tax=Curtobacterium sp. MCJR17_043 TaxID=2175660 RepID=UPI0024DFE558|nr:acyltransferase [Curtobacterium sp. MCJR17_043]WIB36515.1 acyltransferase [Curtobacterium sp. MCJR17_043]